LMDDWNLDVGLSFLDQEARGIEWLINGAVNLLESTGLPPPGVTPTSFLAREHVRPNKQLGMDFRLTGELNTFGLQHKLFVTGEFNESVNQSTEGARSSLAPAGFDFTTRQITSIERLNPKYYPASLWPLAPFAVGRNYGTSSTTGFAISDVISWRDLIDLS